jgi:hypothetical protein
MTTRQEEVARIPRPSLGWCQIGVDLGPALPRAQLRVRRATTSLWIKGFYIHATAFVLVNIALFALNVLVGEAWWFYQPLLGWGIGLGAQALGVFGFGGSEPWGQEWE